MEFQFFYGGIFKVSVTASNFSDALVKLESFGSVAGIDPLDYDDYMIV